MKYIKPAISYEDQAKLLISRGLTIDDSEALECALKSVGYYRLCAYWHPFKQPDGDFTPGTTFETVWRRYAFDRHLRLSVMDAIERVEVAVRTALVHELAMAHGPFVHIDPKNFPDALPAKHSRFIDELRMEADRSTEEFVRHFRANYDEFPDLPIWAAAETMGFGSMLTLFKMSDRRIQSAVAKRYDIAGPVLSSWLLTLKYVRNLCAHHSRLWNRELSLKPRIPNYKNGPEWHVPVPVEPNRIFAVLTLLNHVLKTVAPQSHWRDRLFDLFDRFPGIPMRSMGIPDDWRTHPLWKVDAPGQSDFLPDVTKKLKC